MPHEALEPSPAARILVVDDNAATRRIIASNLESEGYLTEQAGNGEEALALVARKAPDLVLLDLHMPELEGGETCRRIKQLAGGNALPVLILTGVTATSEQVRCLQLGADDFLLKPIERELLLARVRAQLRAKRLQDDLRSQRQQTSDQARRLEALTRMRDDLMHMIVHDLKSPLSALGISVELLQGLPPTHITQAGQTTLNNMAECTSRLRSMVQNILDVSRLEEAKMELRPQPVSCEELIRASLHFFDRQVRDAQLTLQVDVGEDVPRIQVDIDLIGRVIENLLSNALRLSDPGGDLLLEIAGSEEGGVRVSLADRGPGVEPELRTAIFEKFARGSSARGFNHGLGLTFCRLAIETHGGRIWVEPRQGGGSRFVFELPADPRRSPAAAVRDRLATA